MTAPDRASPLDVTPDASGTRVEVRSGIGFVVADGVVVQSVAAGAADFHASLRCASWPVHLKLYRGTLPARATDSMASSLCESHGARRSGAAPEVSLASPAELRAWGADAAARAVYPLSAPEEGFDHEECHYVLKGAVGWRIATRFAAGAVTPVAWHDFSTGLDATLGWEGARAADARVASAFVDGRMGLKPEAIAYADELARWLGASGVALDEVVAVTDALRGVVFGRDPPDAKVDPPSLEPLQRAMARARTTALREALQAIVLRQVATWRDLRGAQIFFERLARDCGALRPTPVRCDCGAVVCPPAAAPGDGRSLDLEAYQARSRERDELARRARAWAPPSERPERLLLLECTLDPLGDAVARHLETCPVERGVVVTPFGARKAWGGVRRDFTAPPEIEAIRRGGYVEFVGLSINEGIARWCGFDLDRGVAVKVERFSGRYLASAPSVPAPTDARYARGARYAWGEVREVVTRRVLDGRPLAQVVALSNALWEGAPSPPPLTFDVYNRVELRDGADGASVGGMCLLDGPARRLERVLAALLA